MRQLYFTVIAGTADKVVIHELDGGRIESRFDQLRHEICCFAEIRKYGQYIKTERTQGYKFQRSLRNDSQRAFTAYDQLLKAKAGRTLFQGRP